MKTITQTPAAEHYLKQFHGETFVIKASGEAFAEPEVLNSIIEDIAFLTKSGIHCVLIYGAGSQLNGALEQTKTHPETKLRITPKEDVAAIQTAREEIWAQIQAACSAAQMPCELLPLETIRAQKIAGHGETGQVAAVKEKDIKAILDSGKTAVIGFGGEEKGLFLNVNADAVAAAVAETVKAVKLIILGNTDGIYAPNGNGEKAKLSFLDLDELLYLLQKTDAEGNLVINGGMVPKVHACIKAVAAGVPQVHVINKIDILPEVLTRTGTGTLIEKIQQHHVLPASAEDLAAIMQLHEECLSAKTPNGTPYLKPHNPKELEALIPTTFVLKHRGTVIGKMHYTVTDKGIPMIGGFAVGENHQGGRHGCTLLAAVLKFLKSAGYPEAISITASAAVKKRYFWNDGTQQTTDSWKQELLAESQKRYGTNANLVELFTFKL